MGLSLTGLPNISQLSSEDKILICTDEGLKTLSAEVLGAVFSDTSLYDNRNLLVSNEINVQNISTHNKLRKYFRGDTSAEVYMTYKDGQVNFIKDIVIFDINTGHPVVVQATDLQGNPLYWNIDISEVEFNNGLPWKNKDDEKVYITQEVTSYPVKIYQYTTNYVKKSEIAFDGSGEPTITDTFFSDGQASKGVIKKSGNSFIFQLTESGKNSCGIEISLNKDGSVTGKLLGTWDGVNDWDIGDVIMKYGFKEWFYYNQDYNLYSRTLSVNTADKVGWYLNKDTTNHVYTEINGDTVTIYLARNRVSGSGVYIQEQAKNILNQPLYWLQDMEQQSGVSSNHIPVHSGSYTFMTTEKTDWPVYIYQYEVTTLFTVSVESLTDGSNGAKMTFTDANNKKGEIFKTLNQFVMRYLDADGNVLSSISLGDSESTLTGKWKSGSKVLSENELPEKTNDETKKLLTLNSGLLHWEEFPKQESELPEQIEDDKSRTLISSNGNLRWEEVESELPKQIEDGVPRILTSANNSLSWEEFPTQESELPELPEQLEDADDRILVYSNGKLVWKTLVELGVPVEQAT